MPLTPRQMHIHHGQIGGLTQDFGQSAIGILGLGHIVVILNERHHQPSNTGIVVDEQDATANLLFLALGSDLIRHRQPERKAGQGRCNCAS